MGLANTFTVKFWGVRGSHPTPGAETLAVGGNTPCVEVRAGEHSIILDAGTGIIHLGRDLLRRAEQSTQGLAPIILLSHLHHDHTQGLPFFLPAYLPAARLYIFGPRPGDEALETVLGRVWAPPVFPLRLAEVSAVLEIRSLVETQTIRLAGGRDGRPVIGGPGDGRSAASGEITIRILRSYAHPGGVFAFRIEHGGAALVYATDTEGYNPVDRRLAAFAQGADLLIHDAQYTEDHYLGNGGARSTQGWGHSTVRMACDVARAAGVGRLALFHYDPTYSDDQVAAMEAEAQRLFSGAFAAREALQVELSRTSGQQNRRLSDAAGVTAEPGV